MLVALSTLSSCLTHEDDIGPLCQRDCATIKGRITTGDGTRPLVDARIQVNWVNTAYLQGGTIRRKALAKSIRDGYYELRFDIREDEMEEGYFEVMYTPPNASYLSCGGDTFGFAIFDMEQNSVTEMDYFIPKKAYVEVSLTNEDQIGPTDYFASSISYSKGTNGQQRCGTIIIWSSGIPLEPIKEVAAEQAVIIETTKIIADVRTVSYDTLYLSEGEKQYFNATF